MKQIVSMMLCLVLLVGILPAEAMAAETPIEFEGRHPAESVEFDSPSYQMTAQELSEAPDAMILGEFEYRDMTSSQYLLDIIKDCEGFSPVPYWDYSQWTIGYGTGCGSSRDEVPAEYWDGISEAKAQELLMAHLNDTAEKAVNRFFRKIGRQPSQNQFDAMVDFSYALGTAWSYGSRVADYLKNPTTDLELVRALGAWCRVDGKVSSPTCNRRMREALIYCYGIYLLPHGDVESELPTVHDGDLPMFSYVIYEGNDGRIPVENDGEIVMKQDDVNYFMRSDAQQISRYTAMPNAVRDNFAFAGWIDKDTGDYVLEGHQVLKNTRVRAKWTKLPFRDVKLKEWYVPGIAYCYEHRIMLGVGADTFGIDRAASRAMVVTVLYRMAGSPEVSWESGLSDIDGLENLDYYTLAVSWAVKNKIVMGYPDGTFRPDQPVNRAEMVTFLYRYAQNILKADVSAHDQLQRFRDRDQILPYAEAPFNWALNRGIIRGTSQRPQLLSPLGEATRAQLARVLMGVDNLES